MTYSGNLMGKKILGYTVDEVIGSGGFGTVYKVSKNNAGGKYESALKHIVIPNETQYHDVLNSMGGDYTKADHYFKSVLQDIMDEIQILQSLSGKNNQHIVAYYDNEIYTEGEPLRHDIFIRMELVTPLTKYLNSHSFTVADVIDLGIDILSALDLCHTNRIIHRDIKDDNLFVTGDRVFKIGDFGVAKLLKDKSRAASLKGTPAFIAPEVYAGKENYDETVDLYSLGIVLYKLLNHKRIPFLPPYPEQYEYLDLDKAIDRRQKGEIPTLPSQAPVLLGEVIVKACMVREKRYNSAKEFSDALYQAKQSLSEEELRKVISEPTVNPSSRTGDISSQNTLDRSGPKGNGLSSDLGETVSHPDANPKSRERRSEQQLSETTPTEDIFETFGRRSGNQPPPEPVEEEHIHSNVHNRSSRVQEEPVSRTVHTDRERIPNQTHSDTDHTVKPDVSWLIYLTPVVIAIIALIYYLNLFSFMRSIPFVGKTAIRLVISAVLSVSFITSLFFAGKKLQERKADSSPLAELTGREAYYKVMEITSKIKDLFEAGVIQSGTYPPIFKKVKQLEDLLKNEPEFGYGKSSVIELESEMAGILYQMKGLVESLNRRDTGQLQEVERLVQKVNELLRRRREMLKR